MTKENWRVWKLISLHNALLRVTFTFTVFIILKNQLEEHQPIWLMMAPGCLQFTVCFFLIRPCSLSISKE